MAHTHHPQTARRRIALLLTALLFVLACRAQQLQVPRTLASSATGWTSIGPHGVAGWWSGINYTTSGPVDAIGFSPADAKVVYTGGGPFSPGGLGLWKSVDAGQTWNQVPGLTGSWVNAILVDPGTPNSVLVETPMAILKSTDAGQTWQTTNPDGGYVLIQEADSVVFATTSNSILRSVDFGSTWQTVATITASTIQAAAFANAGETILLGLEQRQGLSSNAMLVRSTDGGRDFSTELTIPGATAFNAIALNALDPSIVWVSVFEGYQSNAGLMYSSDGGVTWYPMFTPLASPQYVAIDPQNRDVVYVGNDFGVYKSINRAPLQWFYGDFDTRNILFGATNATILIGTDQGLFVTGDGGSTWTSLNDRANNLITSVAASSSRIVLEAQDYTAPIVSCDNGTSWTVYPGACTTIRGPTQETGFAIVDPYENSWLMLYAQPVVNSTLTSALVSHDGGGNFVPMSGLPNQSACRGCYYGYPSSLIAFSPAGETAYFAGQLVHKTTDGGTTWHSLGGSPTNAVGLAVNYQDPDTVYALNSTGLYISNNAGTNWYPAHLDHMGTRPIGYVLGSVAVNPENGSQVIVGSSLCACLERSTDGGSNMTPLTADFLTTWSVWHLYLSVLPSGRVALMVLGTSALYASFDFGLTWAQFAQGLTDSLFTSFSMTPVGTGLISTYGNGLLANRNLSAAFDAAPTTGPISTSPGPTQPFPYAELIVVTLVSAIVTLEVTRVIIQRRRSGKDGIDPESQEDERRGPR